MRHASEQGNRQTYRHAHRNTLHLDGHEVTKKNMI